MFYNIVKLAVSVKYDRMLLRCMYAYFKFTQT